MVGSHSVHWAHRISVWECCGQKNPIFGWLEEFRHHLNIANLLICFKATLADTHAGHLDDKEGLNIIHSHN